MWEGNMAARGSDPSETRFDRALNLINHAVGILRGEHPPEREENSSPMVSASTSNSTNSLNSVLVRTPTARPTELSRLFPGFMRPSSPGSSQWSQNSWKPKQRTSPYQRFKPKDSWTHMFVCLSEKDDNNVPNRNEKRALKEAGLGEIKIVFSNKNGAFPHVRSTLEDQFPKLKDLQGAFEILRASVARRHLELIPMPPLGYTVPFLKEALGQAIAYVRPVQQSLDRTPLVQNVQTDDLSGVPSVLCVNCGKEVAISQLRRHKDGCGGGPCSTDQERTCHVSKLKELFPSEKDSVLQAALSSCGNDLNKAAAQLAGCQEDDDLEEFPPAFELEDSNEGPESSATTEQFDENSVSDVMTLYKNKKNQGTEFIEVNRMHMSLLRQIMRFYKNPQFQLTKSLDVHFYNEQCADLGGPTREFFHDAIACFTKVDPAFNIQLFGGLKGHLVPFYGVDAVSSGCFEIAGKVVAHSILHDGPGFVGLAPSLVDYLVTGSVDAAKGIVSLEDLPDLELKQFLEEILQKEVKDIEAPVKDRVEELMVRHGLTDVPLDNLNKDKAVNDLLVAEVLITRTLALNRFYEGLNCLGLGSLMRKYPVIRSIVFPTPDKVDIDPDTLKRKLQVAKAQTEESHKEGQQSWDWFLQFIEEAGSCEDESSGRSLITSLVLFITGSTIIDPQESFQVIFQTNTEKKLLEADTCFNRVIIPTSHQSYEDFASACKLSVTAGATGYGRF